ncbi:MAG: redoxin domain-containing protein [Flavobacteriales bacterium]|nr:redoxin domain-containing protein [Flavobacteriales bacterium]
MKILKVVIFCTIASGVILTILSIFWAQEVRYLLPTPIPEDYSEIKFGEKLFIQNKKIHFEGKKPALIHFYQKKCPCSRFNLKQFKDLVKDFGNEVDFHIVITAKDDKERDEFVASNGIEGVSVILDDDGSISDEYGVYSTPQAVIIKRDSTLFYRGNYNQARFCTKKETSFVNIALTNLINDAPLPQFSEVATKAYGCTLPSDSTNQELTIIDLLNFK